MAFSFVTVEEVKPLIKGSVTGWREDLLEKTLQNMSIRLSAWYPGLRVAFDEADEDSDLVGLVKIMISEVARKVVSNPDGMASETAGPYAYSRFDSEDYAKSMFNRQDLASLELLLNSEKSKKARKTSMYLETLPAAPMPRRGRYTNSDPWRRH